MRTLLKVLIGINLVAFVFAIIGFVYNLITDFAEFDVDILIK
jgi:hypothetical protein